MDHLTSPKLEPGVHCLNLRHKGMYVHGGVPIRTSSQFYDQLRLDRLLVRRNAASGFGPDGVPVARTSARRARLLQALNLQRRNSRSAKNEETED